MANISDLIEEFLLSTLGEDNSLKLSRNELANYFDCAPSQINYVLSTRFTPERGYIIESRRGGGGSVTVVRLNVGENDILNEIMNQSFNEGISAKKASQILERLRVEGYITDSEERIINAAISEKALLAPAMVKDKLRASIFKSIVCEIIKNVE